MYIPYGRQWIDDDDIKAVVKTLKSDFLTTGPKVQEFEDKVASYVGAKYAVAVSNGTAALHCACYAAGIKADDEVITTPITFAASANAVLYCGGKPVFADIDPVTYNIDPEEIEKKITKKTKAIIAVDFAGQPCNLNEIHHIARKHNLIVIEDAAHALGADYMGRSVGSISDMTTFSFHPVKHITSGEGGMIVTNDENLYKRLRLFRTHGITREEELLEKSDGAWYYEQLELGYNYRISDIQCSLGISQMNKLDMFIARRKAIAEKYTAAFDSVDAIITPKQDAGCISSWHLYVIQVKHNREKVFNELRQAGIGVNVHYIPVYKMPYYQKLGYNNTHCSNAENFYQSIISIPVFPGLTDDEQDYIIKTINKAVQEI